MHELWTKTVGLSELPKLAAEIATTLSTHKPFCLWLQAPLGAGKTTLTGAILRSLGWPESKPVTSPTFTYMNEYKIGERWYAHLDLYRAGPQFHLEDLGLVDARPFAGYFVEWPEQVPKSPALAATHVLTLAFTAEPDQRLCHLGAKK